VARQSIRAAADLPVGIVLADSDLLVKRPGDGLEPWRLEELLGRRLIRPVSADDPIRTEDLEELRS
jgi:sialic acid synthase SpsE